MRVCLVTAEYHPQQGGVGDYTRELAAALRRQGVDALVLTGAAPREGEAPAEPRREGEAPAEPRREGEAPAEPRREGEAPAEPRREGEAPAEPGPLHGAEVPVLRRIRSWGWRSWRDLEAALRSLEPQIVHIQYQAAAYGLHPAINLWPRYSPWRRSTAVTFHDLRVPYLFPKAGPLRFRAVLELARSSAQAIVTNAEDQNILRSYLPRPPALIPIGANIHPAPPPGYDRATWRARAGVAEDEVVLAYFGFLNESKGGEELVEALALLRQRGLPARLWLVGGQVGASDPTNQAYLARVCARIAALGLEPFVRWTGYTAPAEVSANLLAADLCVLPYRDGVSFRRGSLMAALVHGLPVISTFPRQPLAEVVDGRNMALVPPADAAALATCVTALIADPAARRRLGDGALALAAQFDWDPIAARTMEVYDALVQAGSRQ